MRPIAGIIDDDSDFCREAAAALDRLGFQAIWSDDPSAFASLDRSFYKLILIDLAMPSLDGIDLLNILSSYSVKPKLIIVSAYPTDTLEAAQLHANSLGFEAAVVLRKPIGLESLRQAITSLSIFSHKSKTATTRHHLDMCFSDSDFVAAQKNQMEVYYQPVFELSTGSIVSLEALLRWNHPKYGHLSAGSFIRKMMLSSVSKNILPFVFSRSLEFLASCIPHHPNLSVSVNLQSADLLIPSLPKRLRRISDLYRVPPSNIKLEILEYADAIDSCDIIGILTQLRLAGFCLSIDDFGVGMSNMDRLALGPFTELKIDRQFMVNGLTSNKAKDVLRAIRHVSSALSMTCTAEGIENEDLLNLAVEINVDRVQGFHMGLPASKTEALALLNCF